MLRTLHVRDFVIVDQATIDFDTGFTVFSGETGAGKSILIDALSLVLGARGDAKAIREGCARTEVSAHFDCEQDIQGWLSERDFVVVVLPLGVGLVVPEVRLTDALLDPGQLFVEAGVLKDASAVPSP